MKKRCPILFLLSSIMIFFSTAGVTLGQPKISNFDMSPKEISYKAEVTISFDYENVEGGLKEVRYFSFKRFSSRVKKMWSGGLRTGRNI